MIATPHAQTVARLAARGRHVRVAPGTRLFEPGQACENFVFVEKGRVRVELSGASGRKVLLYTVGRGQICALTTACLLGGVDYAAEGIADGKVELVVVARPAFDDLMATDAAFRRLVFEAIGRRLGDLMLTVEAVAFERIAPRLAKLLLARADGADALVATHQSLAADIGTAREVVSRNLKAFERRGWIAMARSRIVLRNRDKLSEIARQTA